MKVYVRGYGKIESSRPIRPFDRVENVGVDYSQAPEWRIPAFHAEYELEILRKMRVRVGNHYCDFALEKLAEDEFAIVCESHPPLQNHPVA